MKKVKARVIKVDIGFIPVIYITGRWRSLGTPFSPKAGKFMPQMKKQNAIRAANNIAKALGITLEWEDSK